MAGKPPEVIQMATMDLAKDRLVDQALMAQESLKRNYQVDPGEVSKQMKQWIRQNGGKKAFEAGKHPVIKDKESLRKEIVNQIKFNMLLEEESKSEIVNEEEARAYYDSRPDLFRSEVMVNASHFPKKQILTKNSSWQKSIISIRDELENGADFTVW